MKLKIFLSSVFLLFVSIVIALYLSSIYLSSYNERCGVENFYKQPKNSVDAVIIGPSSANYAWNPLLIWKNFGLVTAKYCLPACPASALKYLIKETYKTQKPKVLLLYIDNVYYIPTSDSENVNYIAYNLPLIKNSFEKLQIINGIRKEFQLSIKECLPLVFPIIYFHGRWKFNFTQTSANNNILDVTKDRFFTRYNKVKVITHEEMVEKVNNSKNKDLFTPENIEKILERQKQFAYDVIDYSKKNNIPLLLVASPLGCYYYFEDQYKERIQFNKQVFEYAQKAGIPYVDLLSVNSIEKLNITKDDFMDYAHLNYCGAYKFQKALVKILKDDYGLEDKRTDKKYEYLNNQYNEYRSLIKELYNIDLDKGFEKLCS